MKIKDLLEAVGYIAKNSKEASDPRYSMSITKDVRPGETSRQAKKFGNSVPPPVINSKAAKNSTPNKLMNLGLSEAADPKTLKKDIIATVKHTDDANLLQKVLDTLHSNGLDTRLLDVLAKNNDTKKYMETVASMVLSIPGTVEDKNRFVENFSKGFVDTKKLLDGKYHTLNDIIPDPFAYKVFLRLSTLKERGVGPGEIALGILSPQIKWVGQSGGGGDINVNGTKVEVKGKIDSGGRWVDPGKSNRDIVAISTAFQKAGITLPNYYNVDRWVQDRETIEDKKVIRQLATVIADSNFKFTNTSKLIHALESKDASTIKDEFLSAGFDNYKASSKFDGILLLDVSGGNVAQYFNSYAEAKGKVRYSTVYLYAPATDSMPKVELKVTGTDVKKAAKGDAAKAGTAPAEITPSEKRKPTSITANNPRGKEVPKGAGRKER